MLVEPGRITSRFRAPLQVNQPCVTQSSSMPDRRCQQLTNERRRRRCHAERKQTSTGQLSSDGVNFPPSVATPRVCAARQDLPVKAGRAENQPTITWTDVAAFNVGGSSRLQAIEVQDNCRGAPNLLELYGRHIVMPGSL